MENIDLIYNFFNQFLFSDVKSNIDLIEHYYQTNPDTMGNRLAGELIDSIRKYPFESLDLPYFQALLTKIGKTKAESDQIIGNIIRCKQYTKEQVKATKEVIRDICAREVIARANFLYNGKPQDYLKYIKQIDFKQECQEYLSSESYQSLDINSIVNEIATEGEKCCFEWLNDTYEPTHTLSAGIYLFCATPGSGKTLCMTHLSLFHALNGIKTHALYMGDVTRKDMCIRYCASYSGLSFRDTALNIRQINSQLCSKIGDNLSLTIVPAGVIDIDEYIDYMLKSDYKVCLIDYDHNFSKKGGKYDDGLFYYFEHLYEALTKLSAAGKIVYICSQVKSGELRNELLDESSISGSRRKIEMVDASISLTKLKGIPNPMCKFYINKNRRGREGDIIYTIRLSSGRFKEIPRAVFDNLSQLEEHKNFTEADIDLMVSNYHQNMAKFSQQQQGIQRPVNIKNPF